MHSKRNSIFIVFLLVITLSCSGITFDRAAVFESPEDAITRYFEGLAEADFDKISQSLATDEMSEQFDFEAYTEMLGGIFLPVQSLSPTDYPLYVESNRMQLSAQNFSRVRLFTYSLLSSEEVEKGATIQGMDAERIEGFIKDVDPARLSDLEVIKIAPPNETVMDSSKYLKHAATIAHIYGADEFTERVALFSFEGDYYYLGFTLLRYDENWKIGYATSALSNASVMGAPEKTTQTDFESLIDE